MKLSRSAMPLFIYVLMVSSALLVMGTAQASKLPTKPSPSVESTTSKLSEKQASETASDSYLLRCFPDKNL